MARKQPADGEYRLGAGIVLINSAGDIFAGQRRDNPDNAWQMPQGGLDWGELPEEAALRELEEETGVHREHVIVLGQTPRWISYDLPDDLRGKLWRGKFRGQQQMWFAMRLTGPDTVINIETDEPEFRSWAWMSPARLIDEIVEFKQDMYREIFEELGHLIEAVPA